MSDYYAPEEVESYWSERHRIWDETWTPEQRRSLFAHKHQWYNERFAHILPIPAKPTGTVLDYGCGCGMYSAPLLERFESYTGIDISPAAILISKKEFGETHYRHFMLLDDFKRISIGNARTFDCVLSITVLQHLPIENRLATIQFIKSMLKPTGIYVGLEWNGIETQARDMPAMPTEQWIEAWLPWRIVPDDPPVKAWVEDHVWVARMPA